jgi:hypothetical protein
VPSAWKHGKTYYHKNGQQYPGQHDKRIHPPITQINADFFKEKNPFIEMFSVF